MELGQLILGAQELAAGFLAVPLEPCPALGQLLLPGFCLLCQGCPCPRQRPKMGQHGWDILELDNRRGLRRCCPGWG